MSDRSDTSATLTTRVRRECDTSVTRVPHKRNDCDTSATGMKNFDFDNDTGKNIISDPYIYYTASDRLQGEEQFQQKVFSLNQMSDIREV